MKTLEQKNRVFFGLGTVGRDMFYTFESSTLLFFLSDVLTLPVWVFAAVGMVLSFMRIFDALNDPITGLIIDNIRSPWGKFKPAILVGGITSAFLTLVLFSGYGEGWVFIIVFAVAYLLWDITYGINDIGYWTLLPAMTRDQREREKTGTFAHVCATIGTYIVLISWKPLTSAMGNTRPVWMGCAIVVCLCYVLGLLFPLMGVREMRLPSEKQESTSLRQMFRAVLKNDQLLYTMLAMSLFMIGYNCTTSTLVYYTKYFFGSDSMYSVMMAVMGVTQFSALLLYPALAKRVSRKKIYTIAVALVITGYICFLLADRSVVLALVGSTPLFAGRGLVQMLMLLYLADTVEYGQWKLGKRNEAVTFSVQPLIYKFGSAISTGVVSIVLILAGIKVDGGTAAAIDTTGQMIMKGCMFVAPMVMILAGYLVHRRCYRIDGKFYAEMLKDLTEREKG